MKRKKVLLGAGAVSAVVAAALLLTMTASAGRSRSAAKLGSNGSCYPANEFQINPGDTHASLSNVYIQTTHFSIEPSYNGTETAGVKGWVKANMSFAAIDGGPLQGHASVDFKINGYGKGHFESRCIAEAQTDSDANVSPDTDDFEAEFEGTISGLPFHPKPQNGVATLSGHKDASGAIVLNFNVEQGTTCNEYKGEIGSSNEDNFGKTSGSLSADDTESGRWGLPDGFDASSSDPCPDVSA